jgi:hypothetical protein
MLEVHGTCQMRGHLTTCGARAEAQCVYCGRTFCHKHGEIMDHSYEVCTRKACVAKKQDLQVHLAYKASVQAQNQERLCGIEACETEMQSRCNRCKGYFCMGHTQPWLETVTEKPERTCSHCLARRPVWDQE